MRRAPGLRSRALFRRAERILVGGVDSPVRAFSSVGGTPLFFARGRGAWLTDVDRVRYLDLVGSWGANILGAAPPSVVRAIREAASLGISFGAPSPLEHELGERIRRAAPTLERLRFVSSGTEATMSALRVARGFTGRSWIVKFEGGYHGHSDGLLARAGSGLASAARPDSAGVPRSIIGETHVLPYNDLPALDAWFERWGSRTAAVIVEPIAANMGVVPPETGFLAAIGRHCRRAGALSIADEVITGFRVRRGLVAPSLGLSPDLVTLGKVIGGGMPVGAYGGRRDVMEVVAPLGPVYQAGTLAGNPVAMAAGIATLDALNASTYLALERSGRALERALRDGAEQAGVTPFTVQRVGSMLGVSFGPGPIRSFADTSRLSRRRYARFFHAALDRRIALPPSPFETTFVSAAIGAREIDWARPRLAEAFAAAARGPA